MKVIIPDAGAGTRLRPHTHTTPKALVQVAGKPILGHILDRLSILDITELILIIGYMGDKIQQYVDANYNFRVSYIEQKQRFGLGYAINLARERVAGEPILIMLDDTILEVDLTTMVQTPYSSIGAKEVDEPERRWTWATIATKSCTCESQSARVCLVSRKQTSICHLLAFSRITIGPV